MAGCRGGKNEVRPRRKGKEREERRSDENRKEKRPQKRLGPFGGSGTKQKRTIDRSPAPS